MLTRNSEFIRHEPCPKCGSRNNLAIYTDHKFCFGCHYTEGVKRTVSREVDHHTKPSPNLPDDCEPYIPALAEHWLRQYDLHTTELLHNRVLYSESRELLVFPYFGEDTYTLLGWQGRYFGNNPNHPKWFTKGYIKDFIKLINPTESDTIVYVEDIISAIKVGRQYGAVPIFGSHIPDTHSIRLGKLGYRKFLVWLDPDKYREAHKFCTRINGLGFKSSVVRSDLDPKDYNDKDIKKYIDNVINI